MGQVNTNVRQWQPVEFRILGSVEVVEDGRTVELGGLRERTLLARLLLSANQAVSADRLAEDLWEGSPPPHSMATLRVYISRLRRVLGAQSGLLVTQAPGYRLSLTDDQLDAARFERLLRAAEREMTAGQAEKAAGTLREALSLWRGPALSDVAEMTFAQADAGRLEEARMTALENRIEADLACGRHAGLIAELDGLAATYPLRERLTGQRILALYRSGRQAEALSAYAELRERLAEELGIDPSPELRRLHERILRQDPGLDWRPASPAEQATAGPGTGEPEADAALRGAPDRPVRAGPGMPTETNAFVGRELELDRLDELLKLSRLVTLTGPGGSGKSRLALRAAVQAAGQYPDGIYLAELSPVSRPELVPHAIAQGVSVREESGRPLLEVIAARLRDAAALLIVDNCEHVVDAAAHAIATLLRSCPELRVLATSQTRLGVAGEASWPVPPLTVPDPGERDPIAAAQAESVRLFCDRAALARPGFYLTGRNAAAVSEICRQLDGMPLAIELAAARVSALTPGQLAARLGDRFRLLTGGTRACLPRHRTLAAAIEWSHDLLTDVQQVCFRRMSVFCGGCTIDAVEAVCADPLLPLEAVFEAVTDLIDRSLLITEDRYGSMRYSMLESIHQYAADRLAASDEAAAVRQRHLAWLLGFVRQAELTGPDQAAWLDLLDAEGDNARAALEWSLAPPEQNPDRDPAQALELAGLLAPFWVVRGPVAFAREVLDAALAAAGPDADRRVHAIALDGAGQLANVQADEDAQRAYQLESLEIWRELGDDARVASCLSDLGSVAHIKGEYPAAQEMYTEGLALAERAGDAQQMGQALAGLGRLAVHRGELDQATECYTRALAKFRQTGDERRATLVLGNLGVVAINMGDLALARDRLTEHLQNARRLRDDKLTGGALTNLGLVAYWSGDLDGAEQLHREALKLVARLGDRRLQLVALGNLGLVAARRGLSTEAAQFYLSSLDLAWEIGEVRSIAEILEELAVVESTDGSARRAATLFGAAQAIRDEIGAPVPPPDRDRLGEAETATRRALGDADFAATREAGSQMKADRAVEFAKSGSWPR